MNLTRNHMLGAGLAVSLAANCFLGGLAAGHREPPPFLEGPGAPGPHGMPHILAGLDETLSSDDARVFDRDMEAMPPPDIDDFRQSTEAVTASLKAKIFDPAAFQAALQHIHDRHTAMDKSFVEALTRAASDISPLGRAKLADILARAPVPGMEENPHGPGTFHPSPDGNLLQPGPPR
jgi:uncharacterized membrane protein